MRKSAMAFALGTLSFIAGASDAWAAGILHVDAQTLAALSRCAQERDDGVRHVCLDQALRDGGLLPQASPAVATPAPPPAPIPGAPTRLPAPRTADSTAAAQPDRAAVRLIGVVRAADGTQLLAMQDGSVWREAKGDVRPGTVTLIKGQIITIRRAASGGFRCQPAHSAAFGCYQMH